MSYPLKPFPESPGRVRYLFLYFSIAFHIVNFDVYHIVLELGECALKIMYFLK